MENEKVEQEKKDRQVRLNNDMIDKTNRAVQKYLGTAYFCAIGNNLPDLMKDFLKSDGTYPSLVELDRVERFCSDETQIAIHKWQAGKKKSSASIDEALLTMISNDIREASPEIKQDLVHSMFDMAAFMKLGAVQTYRNLVYPMLLQTFPEMKTQPDNKWSRLNDTGKNIRNEYIDHITVNAAGTIDAETWKQTINPWEKICSILKNEDTKEAYEQLQAEIAKAIKSGKKQIFTFDELAEETQITQDELKKLLEGTEYQNECGEYTVVGESKEAILERISNRKNEEEWKQAQERLEMQKQSQTGMAKEELQQMVASEIAEEKAEEISDIQALAEYQEGCLDDLCLRELVRTHKIVLDLSMLRKQKARKFLGEKLLPFASELIQEGAEAPFLVEASTRYILFQGVKNYRRFEETGLEENHWSDKEKAQAKLDHDAYFFIDHLSKMGYLSFVGIPVPGKDTKQTLVEYASSHYKTRLCILTCGKADYLVDEIMKSKARFCIVGRVFDGIRIFPQMLPILSGKEMVKKTIREQVLNHFEQAEIRSEQPETISEQAEVITEQPETISEQAEIFTERPEIILEMETDIANQDVDEVLSFDGEITDDSCLYTETGELVQLTGILIENGEEAAGGEGILYRTDHSGLVAKIYYKEQRTKRRYEKLKAMIQNPVKDPWICWPCNLLVNRSGQFAGYLMPQARSGAVQIGKSLFLIGNPKLREKMLPDWNREDLVKTAIAITNSVRVLHEKKILMGDINPGNILIDPKKSGHVFFVDCDSYQCFGYPCPVGTEEYTHPKMADRLHVSGKLQFGQVMRTEEEEDYCLAILLFKLLNPGQSPFVNTPDKDFLQAMRSGDFAFAKTENRLLAHNAWMIWKNLPPFVTDAFDKVFRQGESVSAKDWNQHMRKYQEWIKTRNFTNELFPELYHEYDPKNPVYQNKTCPLCKKIFNFHKDGSNYKYCFECGQILKSLEKLKEETVCDVCGKEFKGNRKVMYLKQELNYDVVCPTCRNMPCARCGKKVDMDLKMKKYLIQNGKKVYCQACNNIIKAEFEAPKNYWRK